VFYVDVKPEPHPTRYSIMFENVKTRGLAGERERERRRGGEEEKRKKNWHSEQCARSSAEYFNHELKN